MGIVLGQPKKKRKLVIIDVVDGVPVAEHKPRLEGIELVHLQLEQYITNLAAYYHFQGTWDPEIRVKVRKVLDATSQEEANALIKEASDRALAFFQTVGT